jgi:FMN reductase
MISQPSGELVEGTPPASGRPLIVGIGGTTRPGSSTERALRLALDSAERSGAQTLLFAATHLAFPMYAPERPERTPEAQAFVTAVRAAAGIIIATPGYHGGVSGLIKNALDYVEDLREDSRSYFDGRAVGCIVCAHGWQATASTLVALRSVVHALRGWPTPLGVTINSAHPVWDETGQLADEGVRQSLAIMVHQVLTFVRAGVA